ncbi:unique hypothetical [Microscilla marina ATCC 23134]|uniref:Unique hypothetical n=1 Tax=Microscilla marina ATCC 23134 TaxID=313606 RepID=A1ZPU2_MICM2|nr:unique hypothetical [Microscilla marina ATCC 23134]
MIYFFSKLFTSYKKNENSTNEKISAKSIFNLLSSCNNSRHIPYASAKVERQWKRECSLHY